MKNLNTPSLHNGVGVRRRRNTLLEILCREMAARGQAADLERMVLRKGQYLYRQGDPIDAVYVVTRGRLQAVTSGADGKEAIAGEYAVGEPVGESQVLAAEQRYASVRAVCASELVKVPKPIFERLAAQSPKVVSHIAVISRRHSRREQLASIQARFFGGALDRVGLRELEAQVRWVHLKRGEILFRQGSADDDLCIVIKGRLLAVFEEEDGSQKIIGEIAPGETVGEMAILTTEPRSATVYALRDSVLARFTKKTVDHFIAKYPQVMTYVSRTVVSRLHKSIRAKPVTRTVTSVAIVPASADVPLTHFASRLTLALSGLVSTLHLSSERLDRLIGIPGIAQTAEDDPYNIRLRAGIDEQEARHRFIVYEADPNVTPWTKRCIRHADQILIVAWAARNPRPGKLERTLTDRAATITAPLQSLVLLHPDGSCLPCGSREWLSVRNIQNHHHLRWDTEADFCRLARFLSGRAIGLVLSGGGARGFAHLGVIRALREAGLPIDMLGGTSMGALIAAQAAMGWDDETMLEINRKSFLETNPVRDYTLPTFSIVKSRKLEHLLKLAHGDVQIEDLWLNYFCISSNLSTAETVLHRTGPVWKAIRASIAIPGMLEPVVEGKDLLVDGSILNNLPGDVMRRLCGGLVIAVDVSAQKDFTISVKKFPSPWKVLWSRILPFKERVNVPTILDVLTRSAMLGSLQKTEEASKDANLYLRPPVDRFGLLQLSALDEIAKVGYQYARKRIRDWQRQGPSQAAVQDGLS